jgi:hypothetical protein
MSASLGGNVRRLRNWAPSYRVQSERAPMSVVANWRGALIILGILMASFGADGKGPEPNPDDKTGGRPAADQTGRRVGRLRLGPTTRISIETTFDPRVAAALVITPGDQPAYSNRVVNVLAGGLSHGDAAPPEIYPPGSLTDDGYNIIVTQGVELNGGKPYQLVLTARQGKDVWREVVSRGAGKERPGFETLLAGEEGPLMDLNQRLAATLPKDSEDLARSLLAILTNEVPR